MAGHPTPGVSSAQRPLCHTAQEGWASEPKATASPVPGTGPSQSPVPPWIFPVIYHCLRCVQAGPAYTRPPVLQWAQRQCPYRVKDGPACATHTASSFHRMSARGGWAPSGWYPQGDTSLPQSTRGCPPPPHTSPRCAAILGQSSFQGIFREGVPCGVSSQASFHRAGLTTQPTGGETSPLHPLTPTSFTTFFSDVFMSSLLETCSISSGGKT